MDVYEDLIRVPLVFSSFNGDGQLALRPGVCDPQLVRQVDVFPTLLDLVGAPPPPLHGRSLKSALFNGARLYLEAYLEASVYDQIRATDALAGARRSGSTFTLRKTRNSRRSSTICPAIHASGKIWRRGGPTLRLYCGAESKRCKQALAPFTLE
jgi:hypothetical protein